MPSDLVDRLFGEEPVPPHQENYPGSRHKRRDVPDVEFISEPWRDEMFYIKVIGGQEVKMFTVGALASALGVSVQTIRGWSKKGYIPEAPLRLPSNMIVGGEKTAGRRLYTEELIDAAVKIFQEHGLLGKQRILWSKHEEVPIELHESWSQIHRDWTEAHMGEGAK